MPHNERPESVVEMLARIRREEEYRHAMQLQQTHRVQRYSIGQTLRNNVPPIYPGQPELTQHIESILAQLHVVQGAEWCSAIDEEMPQIPEKLRRSITHELQALLKAEHDGICNVHVLLPANRKLEGMIGYVPITHHNVRSGSLEDDAVQSNVECFQLLHRCTGDVYLESPRYDMSEYDFQKDIDMEIPQTPFKLFSEEGQQHLLGHPEKLAEMLRAESAQHPQRRQIPNVVFDMFFLQRARTNIHGFQKDEHHAKTVAFVEEVQSDAFRALPYEQAIQLGFINNQTMAIGRQSLELLISTLPGATSFSADQAIRIDIRRMIDDLNAYCNATEQWGAITQGRGEEIVRRHDESLNNGHMPVTFYGRDHTYEMFQHALQQGHGIAYARPMSLRRLPLIPMQYADYRNMSYVLIRNTVLPYLRQVVQQFGSDAGFTT